MPRIVSLIASATEIVYSLGLGGHLVGRSHECDWPESVRDLPVCTEPAINVDGTSLEIDQRVKESLQNALSVYRVHTSILHDLRPDVILTQSHCDVCAVSEKDVARALCDWPGAPPRVVALEPNRLDEVWDSVETVATALGVTSTGQEVRRKLRGRIDALANRAKALSARPTVACLEWLEPLMAAGNWVPELVALAGGNSLFGVAGAHSPFMSWNDLIERDPDIIIAMPCGFDLARTRAEMACVTRQPAWPGLRAVQAGRVYITDGNQFFNRPGPRLVESLEILAEIVHPDTFHFGHEGTGWMRSVGV